MKIRPGSTEDSARIIPSERAAEVRVEGLSTEETAACFILGARTSPWAVQRSIHLELPTDVHENESDTNRRERLAAQPQSPPGYVKEFEDGRARLFPGGPALVEVTENHKEPEFPMPRCFMLALAHQWARCGCMSVHAAGLRVQGLGLLVLGESMAGKSTLTLSALAAGGQLVSDDWLLLRKTDQAVVASPLRNRMLVRSGEATDSLLDQWQRGLGRTRAHEGKMWLEHAQGGDSLDSLEIDAILELRPSDQRPERTVIEPMSSLDCYAAILESASAALFTSKLGSEAATQHELARTMTQIRSFRTISGTDLVREPDAGWQRVIHALRGSVAG